MPQVKHIPPRNDTPRVCALRNILYVDDDRDILTLVHLALETIGGFQVEICCSGSQGIAMAKALQPDLIMLDVMMPDMDGPTLLRVLKDDPQLCHIPVIFMTAHAHPAAIEKYTPLGAVGVIPKPFNPLTLPDDIRAFWQSHQTKLWNNTAGNMNDLRTQYLQKLPAKRSEIEAFLRHSSNNNAALAAIQKVERVVHNLAGSGAVYGYQNISKSASILEEMLINKPHSPKLSAATSQLLAAIDHALATQH